MNEGHTKFMVSRNTMDPGVTEGVMENRVRGWIWGLSLYVPLFLCMLSIDNTPFLLFVPHRNDLR